jgi:hypothetical protein
MRKYILGKRYRITDLCKKECTTLKNVSFVICEDFIGEFPIFSYFPKSAGIDYNSLLTYDKEKHEEWVEEVKIKKIEEWL